MPKIYVDVRGGVGVGQEIQFEVDAEWNHSIAELRQRIAFKLDADAAGLLSSDNRSYPRAQFSYPGDRRTAPEDLRIFFAGKEMVYGKLGSYNMNKESTLHVTVNRDEMPPAAGGAASSSCAGARPARSMKFSIKTPGGGGLRGRQLAAFCPPDSTIGNLKKRIEDATSYPVKAQILMPSCVCDDMPAVRRQRLGDGGAAGRGQEIGDPLPDSCGVGGAGLCTSCGGMVLRLANPNGGKSKALEKLVFVEAFCGKAGQQPGKVEAKPVWVPVQGTEAAMFKALEHGRERGALPARNPCLRGVRVVLPHYSPNIFVLWFFSRPSVGILSLCWVFSSRSDNGLLYQFSIFIILLFGIPSSQVPSPARNVCRINPVSSSNRFSPSSSLTTKARMRRLKRYVLERSEAGRVRVVLLRQVSQE